MSVRSLGTNVAALNSAFAGKSAEALPRRQALPRIVSLIAGTEDEAVAGTNCTITADTVNYTIGDQGWKMAIASATSATLYVDPLSGPTDPVTVPPFQSVCVDVYVADATTVSEMGFYLYTDSGLTSAGQWKRLGSGSPNMFPLVNGWNTFRVPTDYSTTPGHTWGQNIYRATVYATTTGATEVTIGHLYLECQDKAKILLIADRGYETFYQNAYPELKAAGIPVTFAPDITLMGTGTGTSLAMTEAELDTVAHENNNSISFHGWDGSVTSSMTAAQLRADTMKCIKWLQGKGYSGRMWRAAFVQNAAAQWAAIKDLVVASGHGTGNARPTPWPPLDMHIIPRNALDPTVANSDIDARFAWLQRTNSMECVFIHGISPSGTFDATQAQFDYYLSKVTAGIAAGWLEAVTFEQLYQRSGGDFIVPVTQSLQRAGALAGRTNKAPDPLIAPRADIQVFAPSIHTWAKPAGAKAVRVICIGAGGGGGSGRRGAAASVRTAGAGGGGGGVTEWTFDASLLGATESVTVGNGGAGGAAVTADSTNGNAGGSGGNTSFGAHAIAFGGGGGAAGATASAAGGFSASGRWFSGAGAASSATGALGSAGTGASGACPGGGSGAGITSADAVSNGGNGVIAPGRVTTAGAGGTAPGGAGAAGTDTPAGEGQIGSSGGGGASSITGAAGAGGNGGQYGAGGGGGGASLNGNNSGAGGTGGVGTCVVITYF